MDDIHPLVLKVAGKLVPVAIGGMAADVKFVVNQLRDSEECGGWQYIMTSFVDQAVGHPTYRFEERTICFCLLDKFRVKVPNIFICHQGAYGSTIGLAAAGLLPRVLGIVRAPSPAPWLPQGRRRPFTHVPKLPQFPNGYHPETGAEQPL